MLVSRGLQPLRNGVLLCTLPKEELQRLHKSSTALLTVPADLMSNMQPDSPCLPASGDDIAVAKPAGTDSIAVHAIVSMHSLTIAADGGGALHTIRSTTCSLRLPHLEAGEHAEQALRAAHGAQEALGVSLQLRVLGRAGAWHDLVTCCRGSCPQLRAPGLQSVHHAVRVRPIGLVLVRQVDLHTSTSGRPGDSLELWC